MSSLPPVIRDLNYSPVQLLIEKQTDRRIKSYLERSFGSSKANKRIIISSPQSRYSLAQIFNSNQSTQNTIDEKKPLFKSPKQPKNLSPSPVPYWENSIINHKLNLNSTNTPSKKDINSICCYNISGKSIKFSLKQQIKSKMGGSKEANQSSIQNIEQISDRDLSKSKNNNLFNSSQRQSIKSLAYLQSPSKVLDSSRNSIQYFDYKNKKSQNSLPVIQKLKQISISQSSNRLDETQEITFLKESENSNLIQKKLGIDVFFLKEDNTDQNQSQTVIDLSGKIITEKFAKTIIQILNRPDKINFKTLKLQNSSLTPEILEIIFSKLPQQIEEIDLESNGLGNQDLSSCLNSLSQNSYQSNLKILNLENNNLGDIGLNYIYSPLLEYNLSVLNLSKNNLTDDCMESISNLLKNIEINKLYLHENQFTSQGALQLAQALEFNNSLKVLDLSSNNMGLPQGINGCSTIINKIQNKNSKLRHLDLSYNNICLDESLEIQTSIQNNQTLLGFHYQGNEGNWYFDSKGYMNQSEQPQQQETNNQQIRIKGLQPQAKKVLYQKKNQNDICWICDGWVEVIFEVFAQQSSSFCKYPVFLHLQFENYKPNLMEVDSVNPNKFILKRMCPPNQQILFFFSNVDSKIIYHSKDYEKVQFIANQFPELSFYNKEENKQPSNDSQFKRAPLKNKTSNQCFELQYTGSNVEFQNPMFVNKINTIKNQNLFSNKNEILIHYKPREQEKIYEITLDNYWQIKKSIFSTFTKDSDEIIAKCFEQDWQSSKIDAILNSHASPEQREEVKEFLKNHYNLLRNFYKYHSSIGMIGDIPAISQSQFLALANKLKLFDGKQYKISDVNHNFISAISNTAKEINYLNPEKAIIRFQFLGLIVRIIGDKYIRNGTCKTALSAFQKFFNKAATIQTLESIEDPQQWRDDRFWNEGCENVLKANEQIIQEIWNKWADSRKEEKKCLKFQKSMSVQEFREMLKYFKLLNENFTEKDAQIVFNLSMMIQVDEINNSKFIFMSFPEFIEALGRTAEKKYMSPLEALKKEQNSEEIQQIKLEYKLELLLNHLKQNHQQKFDSRSPQKNLQIHRYKSNFVLPVIPKYEQSKQKQDQQKQKTNKQNFQEQSTICQIDLDNNNIDSLESFIEDKSNIPNKFFD